MQDTKTVSQLNREKKASLLGEEFLEKTDYLGNYYNAVMERCDPVQQEVIHALRVHVENYERCVAKIISDGFTIQECVDAYVEGGAYGTIFGNMCKITQRGRNGK